jgi:hypothetical protein
MVAAEAATPTNIQAATAAAKHALYRESTGYLLKVDVFNQNF